MRWSGVRVRVAGPARVARDGSGAGARAYNAAAGRGEAYEYRGPGACGTT